MSAAGSDLRTFANTMQPRWLVPIHGVAWDTQAEGFPRIRRLKDGESMTLLDDEGPELQLTYPNAFGTEDDAQSF